MKEKYKGGRRRSYWSFFLPNKISIPINMEEYEEGFGVDLREYLHVINAMVTIVYLFLSQTIYPHKSWQQPIKHHQISAGLSGYSQPN
jgi:hypothetical protein